MGIENGFGNFLGQTREKIENKKIILPKCTPPVDICLPQEYKKFFLIGPINSTEKGLTFYPPCGIIVSTARATEPNTTKNWRINIMKKSDFISNYTEDYTNALQDALKQAKACAYFTAFDLSQGWRIAQPYDRDKHIGEMNANELYALCRQLEEMVKDMEKFTGYIEEMATAKNELESVALYEFDNE